MLKNWRGGEEEEEEEVVMVPNFFLLFLCLLLRGLKQSYELSQVLCASWEVSLENELKVTFHVCRLRPRVMTLHLYHILDC